MSNSQEVARRRQWPFRLGLQENDKIAVHIIYGLYTASLVTAVPALLGVLLAHLKRADLSGSWLESHATWQIRTFWIMLIASIISAVLSATFLLIPLAVLLSGLTWLWFAYRAIKGWLRLNDQRPIDDPEAFL
jgi:uncharacterized membrane protein